MNNDTKNDLNEYKEHFGLSNYIEYITLLNMKKRMKDYKLNASQIENKIYNDLDEKTRIKLEYKNIVLYLKNNINTLSKLPKKDIIELTDLFTEIKNQINNINDSDNFYEIKKNIFRIQVKLNLETTFYTITDDLIKDYKKIRKGN